MALGYLVYERTGSAVWLAITLFFNFGVTGFLTPVSGHIADRYDRRRVMIVSDLLSAGCWVVFVFVREPVLLVAIGFVASVIAMPYWLAADAAIPNLVDEEDLAWANALMSGARSISLLAGPAIGGGLYVLGGPGLAFAVNAISFVLSAALVLTLRGGRFSKERAEDAEPERLRAAFRGFSVLVGDRVLRSLFVAWTLTYFGMNIAFVADPPLARSFGAGAFGYGMIDSSFGLGALVGAIAARRIRQADERRWVTLGFLGVAGGWFAISGTPWFWLVLLASPVAACSDSLGTVAAMAIVQRRSPDEVRGRVFAALSTAGLFANAVGFLVVGPLVEWLGPQSVYGLGGVVMAIAAATWWLPTLPGRVALAATTEEI